MQRFEADKQTGSDVTGRGVSGKHKEGKAVGTRIIVACAIMRRFVLAEETAMSRQKKGFYLTLVSLVALIGIYAAALLLFRTTNVLQMFLGVLLTLLPLVYWLPAAGQGVRDPRPLCAAAPLFWRGDLAVGAAVVGRGHLLLRDFFANRHDYAQLRRQPPQGA